MNFVRKLLGLETDDADKGALSPPQAEALLDGDEHSTPFTHSFFVPAFRGLCSHLVLPRRSGYD